MTAPKLTVVAVIGHRNAEEEMLRDVYMLGLGKKIVLPMFACNMSDETLAMSSRARIDMAEVFVYNPYGQTDSMVDTLIEYANKHGKTIRWLVQP